MTVTRPLQGTLHALAYGSSDNVRDAWREWWSRGVGGEEGSGGGGAGPSKVQQPPDVRELGELELEVVTMNDSELGGEGPEVMAVDLETMDDVALDESESSGG